MSAIGSAVRYGDERGQNAARRVPLSIAARGQRDAVGEVAALPATTRPGAGIHQHRVAIGAGRAVEHGAQRRRVERGIAAAQIVAAVALAGRTASGVSVKVRDLRRRRAPRPASRRSW